MVCGRLANTLDNFNDMRQCKHLEIRREEFFTKTEYFIQTVTFSFFNITREDSRKCANAVERKSILAYDISEGMGNSKDQFTELFVSMVLKSASLIII